MKFLKRDHLIFLGIASALVSGWFFLIWLRIPAGGEIRFRLEANGRENFPSGFSYSGSYQFQDDDVIGELVIQGPLEELDVSAAGVSVFAPICLGSESTKRDMMNSVFEFVSEHFLTWNSAPGQDVSALFYGIGFGLCGEHSTVDVRALESVLGGMPNLVVAQACGGGSLH